MLNVGYARKLTIKGNVKMLLAEMTGNMGFSLTEMGRNRLGSVLNVMLRCP